MRQEEAEPVACVLEERGPAGRVRDGWGGDVWGTVGGIVCLVGAGEGVPRWEVAIRLRLRAKRGRRRIRGDPPGSHSTRDGSGLCHHRGAVAVRA